MANVFATRTGVWSATATWNTSALPTTADDVFAAGSTIYVDQNIQVLSINTRGITGISGGGTFIPNNGVTMTTNVFAGSSTCVTFNSAAPNSFTLIGNISATTATGAINASTGTFNISGNITGSVTQVNTDGLRNNSTGTVNITGSVIGGGIIGSVGVSNQSTGTINLRGNTTAGTTTNTHGINNVVNGVVNIFGDAFGGTVAGSPAGVNNVGAVGITNIVGNIYGGNGGPGAVNTSTGTLNITGSVFGIGTQTAVSNAGGGITNILGNVRAAAGQGVFNGSTGTINITGNIFGGTSSNIYGAVNSSSGNMTVFGFASGGTAQGAGGINNSQSGTVIVNGSIYGATGNSSVGGTMGGAGTFIVTQSAIGGTGGNAFGFLNNSAGRVIIDTAIGGTAAIAYGAFNNLTGFMYVRRVVANDWGLGAPASIASAVPGIFGSQTGTTIVESIQCGVRGQWPTAGNVFIIPQSTSTVTLFTSALSAGPSTVLFTSLSTNIVPPVSSVRLGTRYNLNDYTGTCVIPSISSVLQGVSVDNSIGIAALQPQTIWDYSVLSATDVNSLGGRLKEVATVQSIGQQLTALN